MGPLTIHSRKLEISQNAKAPHARLSLLSHFNLWLYIYFYLSMQTFTHYFCSYHFQSLVQPLSGIIALHGIVLTDCIVFICIYMGLRRMYQAKLKSHLPVIIIQSKYLIKMQSVYYNSVAITLVLADIKSHMTFTTFCHFIYDLIINSMILWLFFSILTFL